MKKRVLSAVIAGIIILTSVTPTIKVSATPEVQNVEQARSQFDVLLGKVNDIKEKIQVIDNQISPLVEQINSNKSKIESINKEIEKTNEEIEKTKEEIAEKEEVLGTRLREIYKSGGQTSYLSMIFSAESFSDLINKIESATTIIKLDQKVVKDVVENKEKLDSKVKSLKEDSEEILKLNEEIEVKKAEQDTKKAEQKVLLDEAEVETAKFDKLYLVDYERELVAEHIAKAKDSSTSLQDLRDVRDLLRSIRDVQIKSPTVKAEINAAIEKAKATIASKEAEEKNKQEELNRANTPVSNDAAGLIAYARQFLGKPYVYGAKGPNSFDCSGFTSYVYRNAAGIEIGGSTYSQINAGREVSYSQLQPGDLVFPHADHVGIYIGNGQMIHAPQTGDVVRVAPVYRFWRARRIL